MAPRATLFVSSGEVYGANPPVGVDEDFQKAFIPETKRDVYPKAKLAAEHALGEMWQLGYTTPFIARLFHTFGPGLREDDGRSFGDFLWSAARGKKVVLKTSGQALRTFLYLEDAIAGLLTVLTRGGGGEIYNVGSENPVSILDFAKVASNSADVGIEILLNEEKMETLVAPSPSSRIVPSCQKLRNLGWAQEISMEESISRTISWIKRSI
jgi:nucleoside-diphosphate-sugar epimerase